MIRKEYFTNYLFKATGGSFILRVGGLALSFLLTFLLTHWLGPEEYGIYAWCITWMNVLALFSTLGYDTYLVREVSAAIARKETSFVDVLKASTRKNVALFSCVVLVITLTTAFLVIEEKINLLAFSVAILTVPLAAFLTISQSVLRGMKKIIPAGLPELTFRPLIFLLLLFSLLALKEELLTPTTVLLANLVAYLIAFCSSVIFLKRAKVKTETNTNKIGKKISFYSGIYFLILSGASLINNKMDILMLGFLRPELKEVGMYHVASNLSALISFFLLAANTALAPVISDLYTRKDRDKLQLMVSRTVRWVFLLTLPSFLIFMFLGKDILSFFGPEYSKAYYALAILSLGQLINVGCGSVGYILSMTGNEKLVAMCMWAGALVNVILNLLLIPAYGLEGAAVATMAGTIIWNVSMAWLCVKKTGIYSTAVGKIAL